MKKAILKPKSVTEKSYGRLHKATCTFSLYKKPSSRPSAKSFLIFGHILDAKVSRFRM